MKIRISGTGIFDGEHPCEGPYTTGEWRTIKRIGNILPLQWDAALRGGDIEALEALAVIGLNRKGIQVPDEAMAALDALMPGDQIDLILDPVADPPPKADANEKPENAPAGSSGSHLNGDGDSHQENSLSVTGSRGSGTGAE